MTQQEIFDNSFTGLMAQGKEARSAADESCSYRVEVGGEVLKCAIGVLIPDELYDYNMEGLTPDSLLYSKNRQRINSDLSAFLINDLQIENNNELLVMLQYAHDGYRRNYTELDFNSYICREYKDIASKLDLSVEVIEEYEKTLDAVILVW